jgi:glucan phosphoethanolaminetransferase (alkaline phosphatase superfamily)
MEDIVPAITGFVLPLFIFQINPQIQSDRIQPLIYYLIILFFILIIVYQINMKRHCQTIYYQRILKKTLTAIALCFLIFISINFFRSPIIHSLDRYELLVTGLYLMFCSQISYYITKILISNC